MVVRCLLWLVGWVLDVCCLLLVVCRMLFWCGLVVLRCVWFVVGCWLLVVVYSFFLLDDGSWSLVVVCCWLCFFVWGVLAFVACNVCVAVVVCISLIVCCLFVVVS